MTESTNTEARKGISLHADNIISYAFLVVSSLASTVIQKFVALSDLFVVVGFFVVAAILAAAVYYYFRDWRSVAVIFAGAVLGSALTLMADAQTRPEEPVFVVQVTAFVDLNENGIRDGTEPLVPNLPVHVRDIHGLRMTRNTSELGVADFPLNRFGDIQVVTCTVSQSHAPDRNPYEVDIGIEDADLTNCRN